MPYRQDLDTGEWIEVDAQGNPVSRGQIIADPAAQYEAPRAAAQAQSAQAGAQVDQATIGAQIELARALADKARAEADKANAGGRTLTPAQQAVDANYAQEYIDWRAAGGFAGLENNLKLLENAVDVLEGADTITGPVIGRLPKFIQQAIDPRAPDVRADVERVIQQSLRQILGGQFAQKEAEQLFARSFDPTQQEGSNVERIKATIGELRERGRARERAARHFEEHGTLVGLSDEARPNALTVPRVVGGDPLEAAGFGATTAGRPVDPEYQREYTAWVTQNGGRFTPEEYAAFRSGLDQKYGYGATADYVEEGRRIAEGFERGGSQNLTIPPIEQPLSEGAFGGQARNNAVSNPVGAAAAGFADMAGFGGVSALAPNQMAALSDAHPVATTVGQMGGAVLGTNLLSSAARNTVGRAAPQLLGGDVRANLARDVATDAGYSAIYGANIGEDPLTSAGLGAGGSLVGRGASSGIGAAVAGPRLDRAVKVLRGRNIPMTVPQQLGGFAKAIEDKATSIPLVGDMIRNRRMEGLAAFNREAFSEGGSPIGATVRDIGEEGVQQLGDQVSDAYTSATAGASVPFDEQFLADMARAGELGQRLPRDLRRRMGQVLEARVAPITDTGQMTGEQFQQALRALKKTRNNPPTQFGGFEEDYRNAITAAMDALEGQMTRGAPQAGPALTSANAANRNLRTLEDAATRAAGGSQSGETFMFTPSQLQRAGLKTEKSFPGPRPFAELADAGQSVLPSQIPDSGTAGRLAQMAIPAALGGAGGYAAGGGEGATTGALATALLLLGGTKAGQKALQKAIIDRSPRAVAIGNAIRNRRGLFGSAALPLVIAE